MENKKDEIKDEKEKDKFMLSLEILTTKLISINTWLDNTRTNINVATYYINDLHKQVSKGLTKELKNKIIKLLDNYNDMNQDGIKNKIDEINKQTLLLEVNKGNK